MPKIILSGHIVVPDNDLEKVCDALSTHIALTRQEAGCLRFDVIQRDGFPNIFDVYEEFISKEAFEYHQARVKSSSWGKVASNVERQYSIREADE
ncbi:MAG: putative quinol monooxygenase [Methylophilaceae bacterium]